MGKHAKGKMPIEMFHKIADNLRDVLPHVNAVNFTAVEALFHPRIWEIIDTLREINPDIGIRIDSNGMLLNERNIIKLKERMPIDLGVSLDGCKKETVEKIKTGVKSTVACFEKYFSAKSASNDKAILPPWASNIEGFVVKFTVLYLLAIFSSPQLLIKAIDIKM